MAGQLQDFSIIFKTGMVWTGAVDGVQFASYLFTSKLFDFEFVLDGDGCKEVFYFV